jgi:hypothetical protein
VQANPVKYPWAVIVMLLPVTLALVQVLFAGVATVAATWQEMVFSPLGKLAPLTV